MKIGISLGDVTGVGPEVTLKALAAELPADDAHYVIFGDADCLAATNQKLGLRLTLTPWGSESASGRILHLNPCATRLPSSLAAGAPEAARAAVEWLREGARRCLENRLDALVTAPVSKEAIIRAGIPFVGQTEFLSELAGTKDTIMMLLGHDDRNRWLRVALATTHVPLRLVAERLTQANVELAITLAAKACNDLGLERARVAVCGLNPHAGEGGNLGDEELRIIGPAVRAARDRGIDVNGPISADTLFHSAFHGGCDVVVAMYHDQGLAPLKMVAFDSGVNWTLGLPFIRTSPDHGTAYDIAGKGTADPSSMIAAIRLAKQLASCR